MLSQIFAQEPDLSMILLATANSFHRRCSNDLDEFEFGMYAEFGGFWRVAERCAERNGTETETCVEGIYVKAREFMTSNDLEDRDDLVKRIKAACESEGNTMLFGGKSTGRVFLSRA